MESFNLRGPQGLAIKVLGQAAQDTKRVAKEDRDTLSKAGKKLGDWVATDNFRLWCKTAGVKADKIKEWFERVLQSSEV